MIITNTNNTINYKNSCPFCSLILSRMERVDIEYCDNCKMSFHDSQAYSFLQNKTFRTAQLQSPHYNSAFDIYVLYNFQTNKMKIYDNSYKPIFSCSINPDIDLIKSIAIKFNKLSNIV